MMSRISLIIILALSFFLSAHAQNKPNIVLFFADDAGYADFGFNGSQVMKTPNLDKLAASGVKFTQAYVTASVCGPSRAGIMTGKYQHRFGYEDNNVPGYMSKNSKELGDEMGLPTNQKTMGEYMKELGYTTAYFGKWHLGHSDKFHPLNRGFDEFYGFRGGARDYFAYQKPPEIQENRLERNYAQYAEPEKYLTDALGDETAEFIERNKEKPFFAFLAFNAVHTPMEATEEDKKQFPNLEGNRQTVAAMNLAMDRAIGVVMNKLEELGLVENTIVVFTNDNGGPTDKNASNNYPFSGTKSNYLEGGIRVPYIISWPSKLDKNIEYEFPVSTFDLLPTFYIAGGGQKEHLKDIDGVDVIPYLSRQNEGRPHQTLYWMKGPRAAVRDGDWKLLRFADRPAELYKIDEDLAEQNNLAMKYPEKVKQMYKMLFNWESKMERPRFMLERKWENYDIDRMDKYRKPPKNSK